MRLIPTLLMLSLIPLAGCADLYPPTPTPDYSIRVMKTSQGAVALPPNCPSWVSDVRDPYDNQPDPQFGCASARNLALMAERPTDIVEGRDLGDTRGVKLVGAIHRYDNDQTRGLIYISPSPDNSVDITTSSTAASPITGDVTGNNTPSSSGSASSSSPSSSTSSSSSGP